MEPSVLRAPEGVERPKRARLLVVDDVAANVRFLAHMLADEYEVVAATSGAEALRLAEQRPPDLILLDVEMPDLDGHEVCRRLQQSPQAHGIPVIFVTARGSEEDEIVGLGVGAVDYIAKPYREAILRARVRTHVELKRYRDLLRDRSYVDGLTGVANRRRFDEYLDQCWRLESGIGAPVSLILTDVDCFKAYNDHLGHQAGDDCLRRVAAALSMELRRNADLLARFGGEEFACVMPGAKAEAALGAAQRLRRAVIELGLEHPASTAGGSVSVSVGVATRTAGPETRSQELVEAADRALYRAKREGRNRVCAS